MRTPPFPPVLALIVGILAVSFGAIFIRLAEAPPLVVAAYRLGLATLMLAPLALTRHRNELRRLARRDAALLLASGLLLGLHFAAWVTSLSYTSVASSVVFVDTHPLFVALASPVVLHERLSRRTLAGVLVSVLGGLVIGYGDFRLGARELLGDGLALVGAITVAGYFLIGRSVRARLSLVAYVFAVYGAAAVCLAVAALVARQPLFGYGPQTYAMFLLLALVPQMLGHSSFNFALGYLPATAVSVAVLGEPIGSTLLAVFILGEIPTLLKVAGGLLILAGIYLASQVEAGVVPEEQIGAVA